MNREELIKLLQSWLTTATDDNGNPIHVIMDVDIHEIATEIIKSSLPPAEGAVPDNAAEQNKRMREWFKERTGLDDTLLSIHMEQIDVMLKGVQQQPTAEGAEEILLSHPYLKVMYDDTAGEVCMVEQAIWAIERAATLHTQRIADKMVSERLREELITYTKHGQKKSWMLRSTVRPEYYIDEYLKTREK